MTTPLSIILSFLLISSSIFVQTTVLATQQGFTTRLIHRDSPSSPLSTQSSVLDKYDRLKNSIQRSISRVNRTQGDVQADVRSAQGEYLMELALGTPPVRQLGIVDTGSDLIWTQCQPCKQCYKQRLPIFNPAKSSTYKTQSCSSDACQALDPRQSSCSTKNVCNYRYGYGDKSHTLGDISTETITFNSDDGRSKSTSFPNISFGCGHDNAGTFGDGGSGIVGLGRGPLSLVSQLGSVVGGKFSYCLIPFYKEGIFTSKISFGTSGEVSGRGVVSTPLVKGNPDNFYYLTLKGITVVDSRIIPFYKTEQDKDTSEGNIIIDSGTTLTLLPEDMYSELRSALEEAIQGEKTQDPSGSGLELCYQNTNDLSIPSITAHFDGANIVLPPSNAFIAVATDVVCLAFVPSNAQLGAIWGNVAQMDFLVGYDTVDGKVSFKATDCTEA